MLDDLFRDITPARRGDRTDRSAELEGGTGSADRLAVIADCPIST